MFAYRAHRLFLTALSCMCMTLPAAGQIMPPTLQPPGSGSSMSTITLPLRSVAAGAVGSVNLTGTSFGPGTPIVPTSTDAAIAAVARFQQALQTQDAGALAHAVCLSEQQQFLDLAAADGAFASSVLQSMTSREAIARLQYGVYTILVAKLVADDVAVLRLYPMKDESGTLCVTRTLITDSMVPTLLGLYNAALGLTPPMVDPPPPDIQKQLVR